MDFANMRVGVLLLLFIFIHSDTADGESIFSDLSVSEVDEVLAYLGKQMELRIVSGPNTAVNSSFVYAIEALQPSKSEALQYLDNEGEQPIKKARVIIMRGDSIPPVVEEYVVSPIPLPSQHKLLAIEHYKNPIPYQAQLITPADEEAFLELLHKEVAKVDDILVAITGFTYSNCSEDVDCLTWSFGGPPSDVEKRSLILNIFRDIEGWPTHHIGLECLMLMPGTDVSKWAITWVSFRGMSFPSFDAMRDYYKNVTPKPDDNQPTDDESLPSSQHFRGTPRPSENKRGPRSTYPDGPRFTVKNNHVEGLGWSLDFGMPTTTGPRLHNIQFLGERVAYEISLQETAVFYSGQTAWSAHTRFLDSEYNMGTTYSQMFPGVDCPAHAQFTNSVHLFQGKVTTFNNTACVFELDTGRPLRRHFSTNYKAGYYFYNGIPDNVLVFRSILTVDNYDYILDFIFHQGGQIEMRESYSGYIYSSYYYTSEQDKYGYRVGDNTNLGLLHSHLSHFKVDLDIKGVKNRFKTLQIDVHQYPDPLDKSKMVSNKFINESVKKTEKEAAYKYDFEQPKYLVMYNEDSMNKFGNTRGYRILNQGMVKQREPTDYQGAKARTWGEYQVAITKRKDSEPWSSSAFIYMKQEDPVLIFQDFIDDDETILDEDLVAWVTIGSHHIPIAEDIPIVQTPAAQPTFYLIPFNYFDEDPSLASRDNIRVEPGEQDGQHVYHFSGVPADKVCDMEGITCVGTVQEEHGKGEGEEMKDMDETPDKCPTSSTNRIALSSGFYFTLFFWLTSVSLYLM